MVKKIYRVPKMHCSGCVMVLEGLEDDLKGVKTIKASYQKQQMEVEYDEAKVTEQQIVEAAKKLGYHLLPL